MENLSALWIRLRVSPTESESTLRDETLSRIRELQDFISVQLIELTEFDETLVKRLI